MKQIRTLKELYKAAQKKQAVIASKGRPFGNRPCSAAFVINLQGHYLYHLLNNGLYVYEKKEIEEADS